jgi:purine-binding chemotaxis protein CheW
MSELNKTVEEISEDTLKGKYLSFLIGKEIFGIEIRYVTEIVGIQEITEMPEMPDSIKGIINLRGIIIPVMDVRLRFCMPPKPYDDRTCVIVVDYFSTMIGLIVDSVNEVLTLEKESIVELAGGSIGLHNRYVRNIGKLGSSVVLLLDCEKLLILNEFEAINSVL